MVPAPDLSAKYDALAERFSELDYADADRYYARRARLVVEHGPRLQPGDTVLDIACGDGGLGRHLLALGLDYRGVDASERMIEVARRTLGDRVTQNTFEYEPPNPVDATMVFRSLYLVADRRSFLAHVHAFTRVKIVFDFDPRTVSAREVIADAYAAGWNDVSLRPFLMPQRVVLPRPVQAMLDVIEPLPGASLLTHVRFPLLLSASHSVERP